MALSGGGGDGVDFSALPEGCISHVLSFTTPRDTCRFAAISSAFCSAAAADNVWDRFLPSDYAVILSRAVDPVVFSSKRDLFFRLCDPILIDGGNRSFSIDKLSGKKCFMISARQTFIVWGDTPQYWRWNPLSGSRFRECAELGNVCWLELRCFINPKDLSQNTNYCAYLVFNLISSAQGFDSLPQVATVDINGTVVSTHHVFLDTQRAVVRRDNFPLRRRGLMPWLRRRVPETILPHEEDPPAGGVVPCERGDGWMEIMIGEFYNDIENAEEICASFMEIRGGHWKSGLIILGVDFRPIN